METLRNNKIESENIYYYLHNNLKIIMKLQTLTSFYIIIIAFMLYKRVYSVPKVLPNTKTSLRGSITGTDKCKKLTTTLSPPKKQILTSIKPALKVVRSDIISDISRTYKMTPLEISKCINLY